MPKICIVLATYNGEKYLSQMLDSLVAQVRPADLIIAVDDGSTDTSVRILKKYCTKLPLQIEIHQKNMGHRTAFSKGLTLAAANVSENDYIALADQDDIWLPQKLALLEEALKNNPDKSMVFGDAEVIDSNGKITAKSWREMSHLIPHLSTDALLTGFTNVTGCMVLFKASLLDTILPIPQGVPVHDQWITLCASTHGDYMAINEAVIQYRLHENNAIGMGHNHTWTGNLRLNQQWAISVRESKIHNDLSEKSKKFLNRYIDYISARISRGFIPEFFLWALSHTKELYPHISRIDQLIPRVFFSIVGAPLATKFLGKK